MREEHGWGIAKAKKWTKYNNKQKYEDVSEYKTEEQIFEAEGKSKVNTVNKDRCHAFFSFSSSPMTINAGVEEESEEGPGSTASIARRWRRV